METQRVEKNEKPVTLLKPAPAEAPATNNRKTEQPTTCAAPGCKTALRPGVNKSGYCGRHFHLTRNGDRKSKKANGHANGHANGKSIPAVSSLPTDFREDRINGFLLQLPLEDKSRIAAAWLEGRI